VAVASAGPYASLVIFCFSKKTKIDDNMLYVVYDETSLRFFISQPSFLPTCVFEIFTTLPKSYQMTQRNPKS